MDYYVEEKNIFLFSIFTVFIFISLDKNSSVRVIKRLFILIQISSTLVFGLLYSDNTKDNNSISVINTFKHSISRQNLNNNFNLNKSVLKKTSKKTSISTNKPS